MGWVILQNTPSPPRSARHLSPFQGERMGAKLDAYPLPREAGERCRGEAATERGL